MVEEVVSFLWEMVEDSVLIRRSSGGRSDHSARQHRWGGGGKNVSRIVTSARYVAKVLCTVQCELRNDVNFTIVD